MSTRCNGYDRACFSLWDFSRNRSCLIPHVRELFLGTISRPPDAWRPVSARRAGMKCLAVTNSHPAELLSDADAVVKSLEEVKLAFLQSLCPQH